MLDKLLIAKEIAEILMISVWSVKNSSYNSFRTKKIVAYLGNLKEKVRKLKRLQQKQLGELNEPKQSILNKAFQEELVK